MAVVRSNSLELALAIDKAEPTPAHGETVALALAELGRCAEALDRMRRAIADAERSTNASEAGRLKSELSKYETASCRPDGR
jgi:hypothetical protein